MTVITDGIYDAPGGGAVDSSAAPAPNDVASFTAAVAAAYDAGFGGVIHFDELTSNQAGSSLEVQYGSKELRIVTSPGFNIQTITSANVLSGYGFLLPQTNSTTDEAYMTISGINGGLPSEAVTQIGFTLLSRNATGYPQNVEIVAFFTDDTSMTLSSTISNTPGGDDTFFGFTAPEGTSIVGLGFYPSGRADDNDGDDDDARLVMDDIGFITSVIPEPSSAVLAGGAMILSLLRRRRSHC